MPPPGIAPSALAGLRFARLRDLTMCDISIKPGSFTGVDAPALVHLALFGNLGYSGGGSTMGNPGLYLGTASDLGFASGHAFSLLTVPDKTSFSFW